ncbi:MAG: DUF1559 domain-containing protein [Mariniblastus sp.]
MNNMKRIRGFTLVELLVVIAVIGVLVGMLLPAVQMVRESARRVECLNNLKNLGLAVHNYESGKKLFPPARAADEFLTWPVYLMPFIDMNNMYNQLELKKRYRDQDPNVVSIPMQVMLCASRARGIPNISNWEAHGPRGALGDYAGNAGTQRYFPYDDWAQFTEPVDGIINSGYAKDNEVVNNMLAGPEKGRYGFNSVKDGTSNTLMIGEKYISQANLKEPNGWGDGAIYNGDEPETFIRIGGYAMGLAKSRILIFSPGEYPVFGSAHVQVVNFVNVDGSTHSISNHIDQETLYRLCSRKDGFPVSMP